MFSDQKFQSCSTFSFRNYNKNDQKLIQFDGSVFTERSGNFVQNFIDQIEDPEFGTSLSEGVGIRSKWAGNSGCVGNLMFVRSRVFQASSDGIFEPPSPAFEAAVEASCGCFCSCEDAGEIIFSR